MSRNWIIALLVVIVALAVWLFYPGQGTIDTSTTAPADQQEIGEAPAEDPAMEETGSVADTAGDAANEAADAVEGAVDAATQEADEAAAATESAAEDAAAETEEAADEAADATGEMADDADASAEALTVENFDFDEANAMIENSDLGETEKTTLQSALEEARDSPEVLEAVLQRVRDALAQ